VSPHGGRAERLAAAARERGLDLLIVSDLVNVRWLTGFTGSNGLALLGTGTEGSHAGIFLTDFRYVAQVADQVPPLWDRRQAAQELMGAALAEHLPPWEGERPPRVGFDEANVTVRQLHAVREALGERAELVEAAGLVEAGRLLKDAGEASRIREAAHLADRALTEVLERGLAGRTEAEVALDLEVTMRRHGAEGIAFEPIVASGAHGALPHAEPRAVVIEPGRLVTIDWGARLEGYCSDCTRTFAVGEVGAREREIYALVLRAQEAALAAVRPGPSGREVDAVARDIIAEAGHGEDFGHGLGHGVGLEVHEGPRLSRLAPEDPLAAGMVVTVEPGVYVEGLGGVRIEDLVLVTPDGHDVLNTLPKDLRVVD
jgi:Xaa-Pro aminopeptidase